MAIKIVKNTQHVDGPYKQTKYTDKEKQGKNNTFTWTEDAEEYDYNKGVHVWDIYNLPEGTPTIGETVKVSNKKSK